MFKKNLDFCLFFKKFRVHNPGCTQHSLVLGQWRMRPPVTVSSELLKPVCVTDACCQVMASAVGGKAPHKCNIWKTKVWKFIRYYLKSWLVWLVFTREALNILFFEATASTKDCLDLIQRQHQCWRQKRHNFQVFGYSGNFLPGKNKVKGRRCQNSSC